MFMISVSMLLFGGVLLNKRPTTERLSWSKLLLLQVTTFQSMINAQLSQ